MLIGVGRIVLDFYNNDKASKKNKLLKELCDDIRKKFNISIMEIADFDEPERCVIGFAAVIPEDWKTKSAQSLIDKICKTVDETSVARVTVEDCEILEHRGSR